MFNRNKSSRPDDDRNIDDDVVPPGADDATDDAAPKGDGMHHHELHEDEGGGYHSKHTHPDGRVEHGEHADYDEARASMDAMHGHGEPDGDEGEDEPGPDDMSMDDIAGSYGRAAHGQ
jgi:hypothetical protein